MTPITSGGHCGVFVRFTAQKEFFVMDKQPSEWTVQLVLNLRLDSQSRVDAVTELVQQLLPNAKPKTESKQDIENFVKKLLEQHEGLSAESKTRLYVEAYREAGSYRKAATLLKERGIETSKSAVQRAVKLAGGISAVVRPRPVGQYDDIS